MTTTKFMRYTENNDSEGETWTFWLQVDGNEHTLEILHGIIGGGEEFDLFPNDVIPEEHVDILTRWGDCGYMNYQNKVIGTLYLPASLTTDDQSDLYKGGITDLFTGADQ